MKLRDYILSDENIYLAVYAVNSYVFDPQLLDHEDKELLISLSDPFNEKQICKIIKKVKTLLMDILDKEEYLFTTRVYFKPKSFEDGSPIYRPIHTARLEQLISMVALLHPFIYELPSDDNKWNLNLSNYSRLIPNNFYGNRVSLKPEELFKDWRGQYKKYTQKANEYFKAFYESQKYKYELKLDLKKFFPSVDPLAVYGILMEHMPVTLSPEDIQTFKTAAYKLLVCEIENLNTEEAQKYYYDSSGITPAYTRGIAQGLPQSYFFGNICMINISQIFDKAYEGKSVYYVDDSYIYTDQKINDEKDFERQLQKINKQIQQELSNYVKNAKADTFFTKKISFWDFMDRLLSINPLCYNVEVHTKGKSTFTLIGNVRPGEVYLRNLSREASQIGADIYSSYSEEEDETLFHRTHALQQAVYKEIENAQEHGEESYKEKLERYNKFFKYREIRLRLKTERTLSDSLFEALTDRYDASAENKYECLQKELKKIETFFFNYKHDIWPSAVSILIANTIDPEGHKAIQKYLNYVIEKAYSENLKDCNFIEREFEDYLLGKETDNISDCYAFLRKQTDKKMIRYANMNPGVLKKEFSGVKIQGLKSPLLTSFGICSDRFIKISRIVTANSDRLQRMFLNAVYSKVFKVVLSEDIALNSYDKKGIRYGELRALAYLRNSNGRISDFLNWDMEIMDIENQQNVDYTLFQVLGAYKKYVIHPDYIDHLILVHKYTSDIWKNGAKHLYFYTLHNQEHAIDLVKNIIKIVKIFSYLKISTYDYYLLFIACYLHDISMVRIAAEEDFLLDKDTSEEITAKLDSKWRSISSTNDLKKIIVESYKAVDGFFENKIRSSHGKDSGEEIRKRKELDFLEPSSRENIAAIAEGHMMDTRDIYFVKGSAKSKLLSSKFDKILLRFADLLDMRQHRVSAPILNHNIDNISPLSAFHWISHLVTEDYELTAEYGSPDSDSEPQGLTPGSITETVILSVFVNLSQFSKTSCDNSCVYGRLDEDTLSDTGFEIHMLDGGGKCTSNKCNFLCRWFNKKNAYLVQEMQALEAYLHRVPVKERFYDTRIIIRVIVSNPTRLSPELFEILKKQL